MNNLLKSIVYLLITLCIGVQSQAMKSNKQEKRRQQQLNAIKRRNSNKKRNKKHKLTEEEMVQIAIQASLQTNTPTDSEESQLNEAIARSLQETNPKNTTPNSLSDEALAQKLQAKEDAALALSLQNSTKEIKASNKSYNFIDPTPTEFFKNKKYKKSGSGTIENPYIMDLSSIIKKQKGSVCGVHSIAVAELTLKFLRGKHIMLKHTLIGGYKTRIKTNPTQAMTSKILKSVSAKNELVGEQVETISQNRKITDHSVFQNLEQTMQHGFIGLTKRNLSPTISFLQKLKNSDNAILALSLGDMITKREKNQITGTSGHWITIVAQVYSGQVYLYYFDSAKNPNKTRKNKHIQSVKNLLQADPIIISSLPTLKKNLNDIKQNLAHPRMSFKAKLAFINQFIELLRPLSAMLNHKLLINNKQLIKEITFQITELCVKKDDMPRVFSANTKLFQEILA